MSTTDLDRAVSDAAVVLLQLDWWSSGAGGRRDSSIAVWLCQAGPDCAARQGVAYGAGGCRSPSKSLGLPLRMPGSSTSQIRWASSRADFLIMAIEDCRCWPRDRQSADRSESARRRTRPGVAGPRRAEPPDVDPSRTPDQRSRSATRAAGHSADALAERSGLPAEMLRRLGVWPSYYLRYFYEHDHVVDQQQRSHPGQRRLPRSSASCWSCTPIRRLMRSRRCCGSVAGCTLRSCRTP